MEMTFKSKDDSKLDISSIDFEESKHGTLITCKLTTQLVDGNNFIMKKKEIAVGQGLNAGEAFISALKDLEQFPGEKHEPKISDR